MVTRLGRMSSHHEGVSHSTDLSTRSMAVPPELRQSPRIHRSRVRFGNAAGFVRKRRVGFVRRVASGFVRRKSVRPCPSLGIAIFGAIDTIPISLNFNGPSGLQEAGRREPSIIYYRGEGRGRSPNPPGPSPETAGGLPGRSITGGRVPGRLHAGRPSDSPFEKLSITQKFEKVV